ncbi:MAG: metallophosphoesterase [Burkholderiales bacterium]
MAGFDIIGDVHGHSAKLTALLQQMGYRHHMGAWRHPDRSAIFVGDLIDRGPGQLETIRIVREMVDAGTAQAVLGNHEFNAIAWFMPDPESDGEHLRRRTTGNLEQHEAFLREAGHDSELHAELVGWFLTLPLWLELPGLRVVHACWDPRQLDAISGSLRPGRMLTPATVVAGSRRGSIEYRAIETLIKGPEVALPAGHAFVDKGGKQRVDIRIRWWDAGADTYRKAGILGSAEQEAQLPDMPITQAKQNGYPDAIPVFFGHYWLTGRPKPLTPHAACVDYGAGIDGPLVAYRWDGESTLLQSSFLSTNWLGT